MFERVLEQFGVFRGHLGEFRIVWESFGDLRGIWSVLEHLGESQRGPYTYFPHSLTSRGQCKKYEETLSLQPTSKKRYP